MFFLECLLIFFWLVVVPLIIGTMVVNQLFKEKNTDFLLAGASGVICMSALFYVIVMPMMYLDVPLHVLVVVWCILITSICGISIYFNRKRLKDILVHNILQVKIMPWFAILIILLIMSQGIFVALYQHEDADDAFYVASATTAVASDSMYEYDPYTGLSLSTYPSRYSFSPFPIYIALLSKLLLIHPAIIAHTILPVFLIPLAYAIFALLGKKLFPHNKSAIPLFLLFICVLNIFGNVSIYTSASFLLFRIWQGKAVLANIVLPAILYFSLPIMMGDQKIGDWIILFACSITACLVSSMGILLAPIMIACLGFISAIRNKNMRLLVYAIVCCIPCLVVGFVSSLFM